MDGKGYIYETVCSFGEERGEEACKDKTMRRRRGGGVNWFHPDKMCNVIDICRLLLLQSIDAQNELEGELKRLITLVEGLTVAEEKVRRGFSYSGSLSYSFP